jgi:ABC-2 type transport system ATP-binding protein
MSSPAIDVQNLSHAYGDRVALDALSLRVEPGEVFGLLGPNGSGKTTLFRILSTLIPAPAGAVKIFDLDVAANRDAVRRQIGVVFQSPSLDKQLSARENLRYHGSLYGLRGEELRKRVDDALQSFNLADRAGDRVSGFSGGMRRRVEVAKGLLHHPRLLLMDEPSTGLDPAARIDLWQIIRDVSRKQGVTVLLTTHLMEEADRCDRLGIMAGGKLQACDTPDGLKARIGGDVITLSSRSPEELSRIINDTLGAAAQVFGQQVRLERSAGHQRGRAGAGRFGVRRQANPGGCFYPPDRKTADVSGRNRPREMSYKPRRFTNPARRCESCSRRRGLPATDRRSPSPVRPVHRTPVCRCGD